MRSSLLHSGLSERNGHPTIFVWVECVPIPWPLPGLNIFLGECDSLKVTLRHYQHPPPNHPPVGHRPQPNRAFFYYVHAEKLDIRLRRGTVTRKRRPKTQQPARYLVEGFWQETLLLEQCGRNHFLFFFHVLYSPNQQRSHLGPACVQCASYKIFFVDMGNGMNKVEQQPEMSF